MKFFNATLIALHDDYKNSLSLNLLSLSLAHVPIALGFNQAFPLATHGCITTTAPSDGNSFND